MCIDSRIFQTHRVDGQSQFQLAFWRPFGQVAIADDIIVQFDILFGMADTVAHMRKRDAVILLVVFLAIATTIFQAHHALVVVGLDGRHDGVAGDDGDDALGEIHGIFHGEAWGVGCHAWLMGLII